MTNILWAVGSSLQTWLLVGRGCPKPVGRPLLPSVCVCVCVYVCVCVCECVVLCLCVCVCICDIASYTAKRPQLVCCQPSISANWAAGGVCKVFACLLVSLLVLEQNYLLLL